MSVERLEEILLPHIGKEKKIIESRFTNLVGPGENYGGELLKLELSTEDEYSKKREILNVVAKKIPLLEFHQQLFNIQTTFKAEMKFYQNIVPIVQNFQRENGVKDVIDYFAEYYGGRLNLNGGNVVDKNGVIIMENLMVSGYKNLDRFVGYDLESAKMVLRDLAIFQSSIIALKIKKPDLFQNEIKPLCNNAMLPPEDNPFMKLIGVFEEILWGGDRSAPWVPEAMKVWKKYSKTKEYEAREPFATIVHGDLWVNNVMILFDNGRPIKNKLLDFQSYTYKSPVIDVLNFLVTSVQTGVLKQEFDDLLNYYHSEFIKNLNTFDCDTEPFSYSKFKEELEIESGRVFSFTLLFIPLIVFAKNGDEIKDMDFSNPTNLEELKKLVTLKAKEKLCWMVETFGKRGWLKIS